MTHGNVLSRLQKLEERHNDEGRIVLISHRAIYQGDEIPPGTIVYETEAEAIEAFNSRREYSRTIVNVPVMCVHRDQRPPVGWVTEATGNPETAATIIHDNIPRRNR